MATTCTYTNVPRSSPSPVLGHFLASFPGSPLAPMKNRKGGGEPGIDSHVISRHNAFALTIK